MEYPPPTGTFPVGHSTVRAVRSSGVPGGSGLGHHFPLQRVRGWLGRRSHGGQQSQPGSSDRQGHNAGPIRA